MNPLLKTILILLVLVLITPLHSCSDDAEIEKETEIALDKTTAGVLVDEQITLTPTFGDGQKPVREYVWTVDNADIIDVTSGERTYVATITGKAEGTATAILTSTDGVLRITCAITVSPQLETSVTIQETIDLNVKQELVVTPTFNIPPIRSYSWKTEPEGIVTLAVNESTLAVTVEGLREGTTTLTIISEDEEISASADITVTYVADDVIKILTIGNSFSEDAVEYYLHGLAQAAGKEVVIGNMYIGGASLALHQTNASSNAAAYSYRKVNLDGTKTTLGGVSINTAIEDEDWDYISFQQASDFSGKFETFTTPLPALVTYAKQRATNPDVQYVLHQTWAYAQNSTHSAFPNYGSNQMTMYEAIVETYIDAAELVDIDLVVPSGTAIQNGRTSFVGDNFNSDGYHLNTLGRYTASCTWFEKIFGESVIDNSYKPAGYAPIEIEIAQHAAHEAVESPNAITELEDYQNSGGSGILTDDVYIDLSIVSASPGWNGLTNFIGGAEISNLKYANYDYSGISLTVTDRFNGSNADGATVTTTDFNMPANVSKYSFFGNAQGTFNGQSIVRSELTLSGFKTTAATELCFYASRMNVADNRETQYTVTGSNSQVVYLNTSNNTTNIICTNGITPDVNGEIKIEVTAGPNNNNGSKFFYLGAIRLRPTE